MGVQLGRIAIGAEALQRILDFLPYPFLVSRMKDGIKQNAYVNQKFIDEIGYSLAEMPTIEEWFQLAYPDVSYRQSVMAKWEELSNQNLALGNTSVSMQVRIHTKRFKERWYEVKASLYEPQMVAFIDIHAAKSQEADLKKLNQNRDRVLAVLGHDLRGPMDQLYALARMASLQQLDQKEFMQLVGEVNEKALHSMEFLSTTLTWARTNFDAIQIKREEIDVRKLAEEVALLYQPSSLKKCLEVVFSIDAKFKILADREIVFTVLRNLISNAIKFTDRHGRIEIAGYNSDRVNIIAVNDTGIGMDEATASRILSSNYTSSAGTLGETGLGIGIQLCHDLLKRMGASLTIESAIGKGTAMKVVIPV
ncbi:MAG TPA: HAMP domain-containing sensor histidine kinase [Cyclobacteriaceae bacterium]|jgi:signal transduction histidine kinase|nr:HAMP domain-containing sensor histidine kinase [Cyclobacteriaceae bacterium]